MSVLTEAVFEKMVCDVLSKNGWKYIAPDDLGREFSDVLVEPMVKQALIRLNPVIAKEPSRADEVIAKLRTLILSTRSNNLIAQNERFKELVFEKNSYPFGAGGKNTSIKYFGIDPEDMKKNEYVVTHQWTYPKAEGGGKRLDIVLLVNGFPLVIGELKTPTREAITWVDGVIDLHAYEKSIPQMFTTNAFCFSSEGKNFRYGGIGAPATVWGPWYSKDHHSEGTLADVKASLTDMLTPEKVIDIFRFFTLFATDKKYRKYKIVCRYQQYEGANLIVDRVRKGYPKKGLIWHFQGSGKSLLMVFAAQKARMIPELKSPMVIIVDDRIDLETQMTATFNASDIPNLDKAPSREKLEAFIKADTRKILITTIFKFAEVTETLNKSSNIIVMVDEAHRTQEGDLGERMRLALPNAFFFGLTGTPINKLDKNTFRTFGAAEDETGYMSKYSFADSIRDGATLPLKFESTPLDLHIDQDTINAEFERIAKQAGLNEKDKAEVSSRIQMEALMKSPDRIRKVCEHIANHFRTKVEPNGLKGQVVTYDRECCLLYKAELDKLLGKEASTIVIDTNNDKDDKYKEWRRSRDEEAYVLDDFRDPTSPLKLVIVTAKLLTGFDAPINTVMYLDKPMKDHTLLQAICRTNRVYNDSKAFGLIVDFIGVFDDIAKALEFDEKSIQTVITNIEGVKAVFKELFQKCLDYFPGVKRSGDDYESLLEAQECLPTNKEKDEFGADYRVINRAWNALSPDTFLEPYKQDYIWLTKIYVSIKPVDTRGALIWASIGAKTLALIHENITVEDPNEEEVITLDAELIQAFIDGKKDVKKKIKKIEIDLVARILKHDGEKKFIELGKRLEDLKEQHEQGLINSIDFLKKLLELAREAAEAEKEVVPEEEIDKGKAALTELFEGVRNDKTPVIVERLVNDIDDIVKNVRFDGWQDTTEGRKIVKKAITEIIGIKYKIKDKVLLKKAYDYVEAYY